MADSRIELLLTQLEGSNFNGHLLISEEDNKSIRKLTGKLAKLINPKNGIPSVESIYAFFWEVVNQTPNIGTRAYSSNTQAELTDTIRKIPIALILNLFSQIFNNVQVNARNSSLTATVEDFILTKYLKIEIVESDWDFLLKNANIRIEKPTSGSSHFLKVIKDMHHHYKDGLHPGHGSAERNITDDIINFINELTAHQFLPVADSVVLIKLCESLANIKVQTTDARKLNHLNILLPTITSLRLQFANPNEKESFVHAESNILALALIGFASESLNMHYSQTLPSLPMSAQDLSAYLKNIKLGKTLNDLQKQFLPSLNEAESKNIDLTRHIHVRTPKELIAKEALLKNKIEFNDHITIEQALSLIALAIQDLPPSKAKIAKEKLSGYLGDLASKVKGGEEFIIEDPAKVLFEIMSLIDKISPYVNLHANTHSIENLFELYASEALTEIVEQQLPLFIAKNKEEQKDSKEEEPEEQSFSQAMAQKFAPQIDKLLIEVFGFAWACHTDHDQLLTQWVDKKSILAAQHKIHQKRVDYLHTIYHSTPENYNELRAWVKCLIRKTQDENHFYQERIQALRIQIDSLESKHESFAGFLEKPAPTRSEIKIASLQDNCNQFSEKTRYNKNLIDALDGLEDQLTTTTQRLTDADVALLIQTYKQILEFDKLNRVLPKRDTTKLINRYLNQTVAESFSELQNNTTGRLVDTFQRKITDINILMSDKVTSESIRFESEKFLKKTPKPAKSYAKLTSNHHANEKQGKQEILRVVDIFLDYASERRFGLLYRMLHCNRNHRSTALELANELKAIANQTRSIVSPEEMIQKAKNAIMGKVAHLIAEGSIKTKFEESSFARRASFALNELLAAKPRLPTIKIS